MKKRKKQNVYILPRCYGFNRGDLISQYGFVRALVRQQPDARVIIVTNGPEFDVEGDVIFVKNGILKDLLPRLSQLRYCRFGNTILWAVGQDLVDESSVFIIPHMFIKFLTYRLMGMQVHIVAQGAGPISTGFARFFIKRIMRLVSTASFRDQESLDLISSICNKRYAEKISLVADAALLAVDHIPKHRSNQRPVLGINVRRWYHFNSIIPYEYRMRLGLLKEIPGDTIMHNLTTGFAAFLDRLIDKYEINVRFIPMYPLGVNIWEDDYKLSRKIVEKMTRQNSTSILNEELGPLELLDEFSHLDAMIGVRLHSTILATSLGVPSIHLYYSPKGKSYFKVMGEENYCIPLNIIACEGRWAVLDNAFDRMWQERLEYRSRVISSLESMVLSAAKALEVITSHDLN